METYDLSLVVIGLGLLVAAWLPHLLKKRLLTFPMVFVALGAALYALPLPLPRPDPIEHAEAAEYLTELAVLVALLGAGLRIDTPFSWRGWGSTWRLLAIAMPLTIVTGVLLGQHLLGYGAATAILLGAVLSPTDPVLANEVQVHPPGEGGEDPVRFGLTSEAGLNDGLAFHFVWFAITFALATAEAPMDWTHWLALDVLWRVGAGLGIGGLVGYALMLLIFRTEREPTVATSGNGMIALAITLFVYGIAELCHAYGFIAVFVAAVVVRQRERDHAFHETLHEFAEQCERGLMVLLLILFGGALATGILSSLTLTEVVFALVFVLLVRPLAGWLSLIGSGLPPRDRWGISIFGVRGIGSLYYLAFALNHAEFEQPDALWRLVSLIILVSILVHGFSSKPMMAWLDRRRGR